MDPYYGKLLEVMRDFGDVVMQDDHDSYGNSDIGKFDRLHHWHLGAMVKYGSDLMRVGVAAAEVMRTLGAPANSIDRLEAELLAVTNGTR